MGGMATTGFLPLLGDKRHRPRLLGNHPAGRGETLNDTEMSGR